MGSKNRSIRFKIFMLLLLPLLSLSALWGFVLNLTIGDGLALLHSGTLYNTIGVTSTDLGQQIQNERAISANVLSGDGRSSSAALTAQRGNTDVALHRFRASAEGDDASGAMNDALRGPLATLLTELGRLDSIRAHVDNGASDRLTAIRAYNEIMDALFRVYDHLVSVPDLTIYRQATAMQSMGNARELLKL